jgi:hypothetical protein
MCAGRATVASRRKSEKSRNARIDAQPAGPGPPTPHPTRYRAAKTLKSHEMPNSASCARLVLTQYRLLIK